jgi:quercetin dioxygenase-like cupin family protein
MTAPDIASFENKLAEQGYQVATKSMEPSLVLDDHTHDVEILGLVTSGEITITVKGEATRYGVGDEFTMALGQLHSEVIGPDGVSFVVGRRAPEDNSSTRDDSRG